jgi:hypothetical protein
MWGDNTVICLIYALGWLDAAKGYLKCLLAVFFNYRIHMTVLQLQEYTNFHLYRCSITTLPTPRFQKRSLLFRFPSILFLFPSCSQTPLLHIRDHVSHLYKVTGKIIILYAWIITLLHHPMWRCNSTILGFVARWRWVVSFMPQPLYTQGKRVRGCISPTAGLTAVKERNISCPWRESSSDRPARSYIDWAISAPTVLMVIVIVIKS